MSAKRSSLFGSPAPKPPAEPEVATEAGVPTPEPEASAVPARAPAAAAAAAVSEPVPAARYPKAKTREGKRVATVYLEHEALRQLQKIAFDEETTIQALLVEGVNAVFERRRLSRIA